MSHSKKFRVINEFELKIIANSILNISSQILSILMEKKLQFYISFNKLNSQDIFPEIYLIHIDLTNDIDSFQQGDIISSAGLYFGFIKRNKFFLSLEGAEFLFNLDIIPQKKQLIVNDKGEKAILYGNKIQKKFVSQIPTTLKKKDLLFVINKSNELISIAQSQANFSEYKNLNPNDEIALNLVDKGYYLRKKQ